MNNYLFWWPIILVIFPTIKLKISNYCYQYCRRNNIIPGTYHIQNTHDEYGQLYFMYTNKNDKMPLFIKFWSWLFVSY